MDNLPVDIGQPAFQAVVVEGQPLVIESHQVQKSCVEIVDGHWINSCLESKLVTLPVAKSALNTRSSQEAGERHSPRPAIP